MCNLPTFNQNSLNKKSNEEPFWFCCKCATYNENTDEDDANYNTCKDCGHERCKECLQ